LGDDDAEVRRVAADGVRELVEVVPAPEDVAEYLNSADPVVRAVAVYLLCARRVGDQGQYRRASADVDHRVRIEAVRGLVGDRDPLVRAAARDALGLALEDGDADVRAYARHALAAQIR
jgi:hypothetical protein